MKAQVRNFLTGSLFLILNISCMAQENNADENWQPLFNGENLEGWDVKIRGQELNEDPHNIFRVEDGYLTVSYSEIDSFKQKYGHIFYDKPFSHYKLKVEYRFIGEQPPDGEGWAYRNSGIMVHGQPAQTMGLGQDFPISIEVQLLGGDGENERTTANLCTPGTHVVMDGELETTHCISSTSETYHGDQWVTTTVEVRGDSLIRHMVEGDTVLEYQKPQVGGGVVSGYFDWIKCDGRLLDSGSISLQSESHPVQFRKVDILNLEEKKQE